MKMVVAEEIVITGLTKEILDKAKKFLTFMDDTPDEYLSYEEWNILFAFEGEILRELRTKYPEELKEWDFCGWELVKVDMEAGSLIYHPDCSCSQRFSTRPIKTYEVP